MDTQTASAKRTFDGYAPPAGVYDELRTPQGDVRSHWTTFASAFQAEQTSELDRRWQHANRIVHENGITYNAFRDTHGGGRPWQIDLLPLMLPADEWERLGAGISQRARVLSLLLDDLYGPQRLLTSGVLPPEAVFAHGGYHRAFCHLPVAPDRRLLFFGCEIARSPDGRWWAMADRTEGPAGAGYALENRIVISRTWPNLIHDCHVRRLAPFFMRLQQSLADLTPRTTENPRIVLLTSGAAHPSYFEDVYLARYLGYTLVEGGDLAVRDDCVFIKTLDGLVQIDVILSRVRESELDPLELRTSSPHGVPGLLQALRKGNVAIANPPGCGFVESPVIMAFLPKLCRTLLSEELRLPSIATWWCGDSLSCQHVLSNFKKLVIKPAFEHSGGDEVIVDQLTRSEASELTKKIREAPAEFVAQEHITRSSTPVWSGDRLQTGFAALRTFAMRYGNEFETMPGALVRVALSPGPMRLSIAAGDGSKDAWVISDGPVEKLSLLPAADDVCDLRRNSPQLPSRVADNLFWLGRHLDRAEISARLLRVVIDRLSGERDPDEIPELNVLIRVLAAAGQIEPDYAIDGLESQMPEIEEHLPAAIFDTTESRSLRSTVNEIARLSSIVRDRLSHDTWRSVNRIEVNFHPTGRDEVIPLDEALTLLNQLIIDLAVCSGLINDGMVRGPAWRFLDIGRRVERAQLTSRLLLELMEGEEDPSPSVLDAVLDVMDLQMTYRARYLAAMLPAPVLDLLIADESNPRSILFQMKELQRHVDRLPADSRQIGLNTEQKIVSQTLHNLQMLDIRSQFAPLAETDDSTRVERSLSVPQLLGQIQDAMKELSGSLSRKYLVHSGVPRRMQDESPLPS